MLGWLISNFMHDFTMRQGRMGTWAENWTQNFSKFVIFQVLLSWIFQGVRSKTWVSNSNKLEFILGIFMTFRGCCTGQCHPLNNFDPTLLKLTSLVKCPVLTLNLLVFCTFMVNLGVHHSLHYLTCPHIYPLTWPFLFFQQTIWWPAKPSLNFLLSLTRESCR